ncbi:hypothetical protein CEXT_455561 [Caerostris extrusa]|uniref:TFIIS N-terminal domain-containing protein n=1 Tax=Caerostris extrusa TaxID=172846 RepID=A0AAV4QMU6_CAEEX|nr:hypothetical protein CEXT_455561 [Caerostris extrusa]
MDGMENYIKRCIAKMEEHKQSESKVVEYINKLSGLPINTKVLSATDVVNYLQRLSRKGGEVAKRAVHVLNKWNPHVVKWLEEQKKKEKDWHLVSLKAKVKECSPQVTTVARSCNSKSTPESTASLHQVDRIQHFSKIHHFDSSHHSDGGHLSSSQHSDGSRNSGSHYSSGDHHLDSRHSDGGRLSDSRHSDGGHLSDNHNSDGYHLSDSIHSDLGHLSGSRHSDKGHHSPRSRHSSGASRQSQESLSMSGSQADANLQIETQNFTAEETYKDTPSKVIRDPYAIELRENMFKAVKLSEPVCSLGVTILDYIKNQLLKNGFKRKSIEDQAQRNKNEINVAPESKRDLPSSKEKHSSLHSYSENHPFHNSDSANSDSVVKKLKKEENSSSVTERHSSYSEKGPSHSSGQAKRPAPYTASDKSDCAVKKLKKEENVSSETQRLSVTEDESCSSMQLDKKYSQFSAAERSNSVHKYGSKTAIEAQHSSPSFPKNPEYGIDNNAMIAITSSKKERTSMYSGRKTVSRSDIPTLTDSCLKKIHKDLECKVFFFFFLIVRFLNYIPTYENLKPLLSSLSASRLKKAEDLNPLIRECSAPAWEHLCWSLYHAKTPVEGEEWRDYFINITAQISANTTKGKQNDRHTKLTTVDAAPSKRLKACEILVKPVVGQVPIPAFSKPSTSKDYRSAKASKNYLYIAREEAVKVFKLNILWIK